MKEVGGKERRRKKDRRRDWSVLRPALFDMRDVALKNQTDSEHLGSCGLRLGWHFFLVLSSTGFGYYGLSN